MNPAIRRVSLCAVLHGALEIGMALNSASTSAQLYDPAYVNFCGPAMSEVGDLSGESFSDQGSKDIILADPNDLPHGLNGCNSGADRWNGRSLGPGRDEMA